MNVTEIIKDLASRITIVDALICLPGLTIMIAWLYRTSMGRNALVDSAPRRNNMPAYLPFVPLLIWLGVVTASILAREMLLPDLADWKNAYIDNGLLSLGAIVAITVIIFMARSHFARRLKGFGLAIEGIHKDFGAAILNLAAIYPVVGATLILTMFAGKMALGPDFEMQKHQQLEVLAEYPQLAVRAIVIVTTIVIMPALEEMLFRGMFQSTIRSFLSNLGRSRSAWLSIAASSALFASVHANMWHWPALFVLAMCMGYAYEKSGSLFRPILIHTLFNATSVIAVLVGS